MNIVGIPDNSQGLAMLAEGMTVEGIKEKLSGIRYDGKPTSCPDQLEKEVEEASHIRE